tara:strand:+ start:428 stop:643 length:216 start_codon:yes stop_codon:yes gene_type:complete
MNNQLNKKQLTYDFQFVSRDSMDSVAKYVKLAKENNKVEIEILYRFGKPSNYLEDKSKFLREYDKFTMENK